MYSEMYIFNTYIIAITWDLLCCNYIRGSTIVADPIFPVATVQAHGGTPSCSKVLRRTGGLREL